MKGGSYSNVFGSTNTITNNVESTIGGENNELENTGRVEAASHIPRGMLEVYLDPNSPIFQNGQIDKNKEFVLFCAGGVRSALAVKSLKDMGYQKVSHIDGGFGSIASSNFKII